jgi:hypothetical protein
MVFSRSKIASAVLAIGAATSPIDAMPFSDECANDCRRVTQHELDSVRGRFTFSFASGNLEIAIGIARAVFVNGELVAVTQLGNLLPALPQIVAPGAPAAPPVDAGQIANSVHAAVNSGLAGGSQPPAQNPPQNLSRASKPQLPDPVMTSPLPATSRASGGEVQLASAARVVDAPSSTTATALTQASTAAAQQGQQGSGSQSSNLPTAPNIDAATSAPHATGTKAPVLTAEQLVVQVGRGNTFNLSGVANLPAAATVIQNTLDNQVISSFTFINASVRALDLARSMSRGALVSDALNRSIR